MTIRIRRSRKATSPPLAFNGPRGICQCGHTGNGPNGDHRDSTLHTGDTTLGTGVCNAPSCMCSRFVTAARTPEFQAFLDDPNNAATRHD